MVDFEKLIDTPSSWLDAKGADSDIVLSSRIRLARNVKELPFAQRSDKNDVKKIYNMVKDSFLKISKLKNSFMGNINDLSELERHILVERHLISPDFESGNWERGVLITKDEKISIMVNEEDHLRIQSITSGFELENTWKKINKIDDELSGILNYAYSEKYGYLTACPTNVGTGMRVSVLIHLPALVLTKDIDETLKGITQVGLSVRGFYGEGTEVLGNLFQISNHTTLGKTEDEIVDTIAKVINQLIGFERRACEMLMKDAKAHIEDKIWRAYGILNNARLLTSNEFMSLSSALRLGIALGVITNISMKALNQLMIFIQPAHIQKYLNHKMESGERDFFRANIVREHLLKNRKRNNPKRDSE